MDVSYEQRQARILLTKIGYYALKRIKELAPVDTGNLRYNAIVKVRQGLDRIEIYVDLPTAPYMPYTNEPWLSDKWNGKKNPNEAWWNNAVETIVKEINEKFGVK